jgi:hypothetical protein
MRKGLEALVSLATQHVVEANWKIPDEDCLNFESGSDFSQLMPNHSNLKRWMRQYCVISRFATGSKKIMRGRIEIGFSISRSKRESQPFQIWHRPQQSQRFELP